MAKWIDSDTENLAYAIEEYLKIYSLTDLMDVLKVIVIENKDTIRITDEIYPTKVKFGWVLLTLIRSDQFTIQ